MKDEIVFIPSTDDLIELLSQPLAAIPDAGRVYLYNYKDRVPMYMDYGFRVAYKRLCADMAKLGWGMPSVGSAQAQSSRVRQTLPKDTTGRSYFPPPFAPCKTASVTKHLELAANREDEVYMPLPFVLYMLNKAVNRVFDMEFIL